MKLTMATLVLVIIGYVLGYYFRQPGDMTIAKVIPS